METEQFYKDIENLYDNELLTDEMPDMVKKLIEENRNLKRKTMKLESVIIFQKTVIADLKER